MMKENRPLIKTIPCVNHRFELAIKDAVREILKFAEYDKLYLNIYYLFNNSGKLKAETKNVAAALNISYYTLHQIREKRFLNQRYRGSWPALITGFENVLVNDR